MLTPIIVEVNIILLYLLGHVLNGLGIKEEMIQDFTKAIHIKPQFADS